MAGIWKGSGASDGMWTWTSVSWGFLGWSAFQDVAYSSLCVPRVQSFLVLPHKDPQRLEEEFLCPLGNLGEALSLVSCPPHPMGNQGEKEELESLLHFYEGSCSLLSENSL